MHMEENEFTVEVREQALKFARRVRYELGELEVPADIAAMLAAVDKVSGAES